MNMTEDPSVLFRPSIVAKVVAHTLLGWPWRSNSWSSVSNNSDCTTGAAAPVDHVINHRSSSSSIAQGAAAHATAAAASVGVQTGSRK
jgi:hypothetical protein